MADVEQNLCSKCENGCMHFIGIRVKFRIFFLLILVPAKPVTERQPVLLTPTGSTSTKVELRGNVLLLECIAAGLWVTFETFII